MKKLLILFTAAMVFMYLAFAANHFLEANWFEMPTRILMIVLCFIHIVLSVLHIHTEAMKPKED